MMEILDILHGAISISDEERFVIESRPFQRLREIKQLGFGEVSFPGATHTRYIHSLGTMETATRMFDTIFGGSRAQVFNRVTPPPLMLERNAPSAHAQLRQCLRMAALLHDIGHGPLSHTTEVAMPDVEALKLSYKNPPKDRMATHEDFTLKILLESELTPILDKLGSPYGFTSHHVACLIESHLEVGDDFFKLDIQNESIDFRPILSQIISSEMDCDRMDYLQRDSFYTGASYGQFDFDWLLGNLTAHIQGKQCLLTLQDRALYAFEDFLVSRFHMFLMVYFHYKSVIFDDMLREFLESPDCDYRLPSDIGDYLNTNDFELSTALSKSKNEWANRISKRNPFVGLIEIHSGIPHSESGKKSQTETLQKMENHLKSEKIRYIKSTSTSQLSKYFDQIKNPILVRVDDKCSKPTFIPIEECTDLFDRYNANRSITRIYVDQADAKKVREQLK